MVYWRLMFRRLDSTTIVWNWKDQIDFGLLWTKFHSPYDKLARNLQRSDSKSCLFKLSSWRVENEIEFAEFMLGMAYDFFREDFGCIFLFSPQIMDTFRRHLRGHFLVERKICKVQNPKVNISSTAQISQPKLFPTMEWTMRNIVPNFIHCYACHVIEKIGCWVR